MRNLVLWLVLLAGSIIGVLAKTDYCQLSCRKWWRPEEPAYKHTMCEYPSTKPAKACGNVTVFRLAEYEKKELLDLHNTLRTNVMLGEEKGGNPGPLPTAKYLPPMTWDDELATIAQRWAYQCIKGHDKCRRVDAYAVGQNWAQMSKRPYAQATIAELFGGWYKEINYVRPEDIYKFTTPSVNITYLKEVTTRSRTGYAKKSVSKLVTEPLAIGHYTQLVWEKSTKLGCGKMVTVKDKWAITTLVCNYGPAGNYLREPVYTVEGN